MPDSEDYSAELDAIDAELTESSRQEFARYSREKLLQFLADLEYEEEPSELVLRLPQFREAKANVASATAQLEQANRNLERTKVRAPFAGRVRVRSVGLGQSVGTSTPLGAVFSVDALAYLPPN